ncbi:MAG: GtrA family protein [Desulfamplus sp.]|nr:GtrA family protein [Desulfamplus sp.]
MLKPLIYKTPLRYFFAVVCGYCIDFIIYIILVIYGISVYWSNAAGFCVGVIINLLLIRRFVFPDNRFKLITDLPLTFSVNGMMLGVGLFFLSVFVDSLSINPYMAKLFTNGITFILNYVIRAVFFRKKNVF